MDTADLERYESIVHGQSPYDLALRVKLDKKYRSYCKKVSLGGSCWITGVAVSVDYVPIQVQTQVDIELRMRITGVAVCTGPSICTFDCEMGSILHKIETSSQALCCVSLSNPPAFTKLAPVIAIGTHEGFAQLRDVQTGDLLYHHVSAQRHPTAVKAIHVHEGVPRSLLLVGLENGQVFVWAFEKGNKEKILCDHTRAISAIAVCVHVPPYYAMQHSTASSVAISKPPAFIITASIDGDIFVYNMRTYDRIAYCSFMQEHSRGPVLCLAAHSYPHCWVVSGGQDGVIKVWNLLSFADGSDPLLCDMLGHTDAVTSIASIPGTCPAAVSGSNDLTIRIWDLERGQQLAVLSGHTHAIRAIAVTTNPRLLIVSGGYDNTVRVWDISKSDDLEVRNVCTYLHFPVERSNSSSSSSNSMLDSQEDNRANVALVQEEQSAEILRAARYIPGLGYIYEEENDNKEGDADIYSKYSDSLVQRSRSRLDYSSTGGTGGSPSYRRGSTGSMGSTSTSIKPFLGSKLL